MAINTHYSEGIGGSGGAHIIVTEPETELATPVEGETPETETPQENEG